MEMGMVTVRIMAMAMALLMMAVVTAACDLKHTSYHSLNHYTLSVVTQ